MKSASAKRAGWLAEYTKLKRSFCPTECARCNRIGQNWVELGGDFEPHHPFQRRTRWAILTFIPLCSACHRWVHDNGKQARADGWIIDYRTVPMTAN